MKDMEQAINHELLNLIDNAANWETRLSTFALVDAQLLQRKKFAKDFQATGDREILPLIDVCNNNIKKLLGL